MFRLLILLVFLGTLVLSSANSTQLERAGKNLKSSSKSDQFKAYNTYKQLYIKALADGDKTVCYNCLKGIVSSGEKLHIDIEQYRKKLKNYPLNKPKKNKNKSASRTRVKSKSATSSTKKSKVKKQRNKIIVTGQKHLKQIQWNKGSLVVRFDSALSAKDINYFTILDKKKKRYRYIFEVHAVQTKKHTIKHKEIKRIRLGQYKPNILRLVIEGSRPIPVRFKRDNELLVIDLGVKSVQAPLANKPMRRKDKTVVIDPGHGGKDGGAVGYKRYLEKRVVLQIANRFAKILKNDGYKVYMTRTSDKFIKLRHRTKYANKKNADLFISIHANAVPKKNVKKAHGIETYFLSTDRSARAVRIAAKENAVDMKNFKGGQTGYLEGMNNRKTIASNKLAIDIQQGVLSALRPHYKDVKDGGVRGGPFWVLVGAQMPAVLVEVGFISHPKESLRLVNKTYQQRFAQGLADSVNRYFTKNP